MSEPREYREYLAYEFYIDKNKELTSNQRLHHMEEAKRRNFLRQLGAVTHLSKHGKHEEPLMSVARALCTLHFPTAHRRDPNNWWPTAKSLIDGMVTGHKSMKDFVGVLPEDDYLHLLGPDMRMVVARTVPKGGFRLVLEFMQL